MNDELESAFELLEEVAINDSTEAAKALNRIENYIASHPQTEVECPCCGHAFDVSECAISVQCLECEAVFDTGNRA